nr:uncharacterized protein LOC126527937 [Dermacentor andersoni]
MKYIQKENAEIKAENACLTSECTLLKKRVLEAELRIVQLDQYSRNKNLEIKGVPTSQSENLSAILKKIGDVVSEPISENDVEICHRVPTRDSGQSNIVVQFRSRSKRDAVLNKTRKKRLSATDLGYTQSCAVFVNEHLCSELKKLLGMTIARKREKNWRFAWTRDGKIFARKSESCRSLQIMHVSDLEKID